MNHYEWTESFRQAWEKARAMYLAGERVPASFPALPEIGLSAQELYDFVEDAPELSYDTALLVTAVRRDYFLVVQKGQPAGPPVPLAQFPAKEAELAGHAWLPRILLKARCKLRGELPVELMYPCGADRRFLRGVNTHPADFLRAVWAARDDDHKIVAYLKQGACQSV